MKILVGLSGGVDSSVAALILKQQGHEVVGATMSIWGKDGMAAKSDHKNTCYGPDEKEDIEEARKIAAQIGIPYYVFNCVEQYEQIVLDNFKSEYIQGRTPNPCVWCNALVKFGVLPLIAKENGIELYSSCDEIFQGDDYVNKKIISAEKNNDYLYVYEKHAFAKYSDTETEGSSVVNYYKDYNRTTLLEKDLDSIEFTDAEGNVGKNSTPKWDLYNTYKYTFKIIDNNYYFQSFELTNK